jgi:hypothetical protein
VIVVLSSSSVFFSSFPFHYLVTIFFVMSWFGLGEGLGLGLLHLGSSLLILMSFNVPLSGGGVGSPFFSTILFVLVM